ncbi:MAG: RDD family protein [Gemella haemolysans]|mgnify:FL=1|jgi:RDD family protein|uniref:RDD family protein n=1 Tax=Gemella haemolysans TaxID=1379 RepID=UPI0012076435|nr:RDD family protein [Gemella haemolysans]MBS5319200.1 RDD family protein [Gemella haemolysans]MDU6766490.1 RDD family protein [Gemella haemolysans]TKW62795.1 MAG: RDD family protein [Gemella sp.]
MVKKIKKNSSYSYNDRNIKPTLSDISGPIEEPLLDVNGETASIVKRFFAYLIDLAIYLPIAFVFQYTTANLRAQGGAENERNALYMTISIVIFAVLLYGYLPHKWQGQTIGKKLLKIRLVPTDNKKIEFSRYLIREFLIKVTVGWAAVPVSALFWLYETYILKRKDSIMLYDRLLNMRVVAATEQPKVEKVKEDKEK